MQDVEYIPREGGFILASNHASLLDPIFLGISIPRPINYMAKDSLFRNPVLGSFLLSLKAFPVKRWSADLTAIKESLNRLKKGQGLVVFPEGTRNSIEGKGAVNLYSGFIFLANKANVPIIPAYISGSEKALARGAKCIKPVKVRIRFGSPIYLKDSQDYAKAALGVYEEILRLKSLTNDKI